MELLLTGVDLEYVDTRALKMRILFKTNEFQHYFLHIAQLKNEEQTIWRLVYFFTVK